MKKNYTVEKVEEFVQNTTIKITLLASMLIMLLNKSVLASVIFIMMSFIGYLRFYCMSELLNVCIRKKSQEIKHCILNYVLTCFITVIFLTISLLNYGKIFFIYGIIGIVVTNLIIMSKGILNGILGKVFKL